MKKWVKDLNANFSKEEIQMANKQMKRWSIYLGIKKMQIKPKWNSTSYLLGWLLLKIIISIGEDIEKIGHSYGCLKGRIGIIAFENTSSKS